MFKSCKMHSSSRPRNRKVPGILLWARIMECAVVWFPAREAFSASVWDRGQPSISRNLDSCWFLIVTSKAWGPEELTTRHGCGKMDAKPAVTWSALVECAVAARDYYWDAFFIRIGIIKLPNTHLANNVVLWPSVILSECLSSKRCKEISDKFLIYGVSLVRCRLAYILIIILEEVLVH